MQHAQTTSTAHCRHKIRATEIRAHRRGNYRKLDSNEVAKTGAEHHKSLFPGSSQRDRRSAYPWDGHPSCLRHPRVAQSGEIGCFEQDTDRRPSERSQGPQTRDARVTVVATQLAGLGEFGGGAPSVTLETEGGGKVSVRKGLMELAVCALSNQRIASSRRDCSRCTCPIQ